MSENVAKSTRRHDLDWLRMVAVLLLIIPFHSARVFDVLNPFYVVVRWDMGVWPKFTIVLLSSFAASLILYEFVVRRTDATRFLFGMRHRPLERVR